MGLHGEGTVYQRASDQRWIAAVTDPATGKRVTRSAKTQAAAEAKRKEMLATIAAGGLPSNLTVSDWVRYWIETVSDNRPRSLATQDAYAHQWIYSQPIGRIPLQGLREDHIRAWHATLRNHRGPRSPEGLADNTLRRIHSVLQGALTAALRDRRVQSNVAANVAPVTRRTSRPRPPAAQLDANQARQLIDATVDYRMRARLVVAFTGLRQSEALALRWDECPPGLLTVAHSVHRVKGKGLIVEDEVKNRGSLRQVPLGPAFATIVEAWRIESGGNGWLFPGHNPTLPEDPRRDLQSWYDALEHAGLPRMRLHGARGASASAMMAQPVRVAADILGHAQVRMTTDVYQRSSLVERQAAAAAIEAVVLGES